MRFLVTGATGFIGSNLAFELQKKGSVVGLCNSTPGSKENLKNFKGEFFKGDIRFFDYDSLGKFDAIFHQAAISYTLRLPLENPPEFLNGESNLGILSM